MWSLQLSFLPAVLGRTRLGFGVQSFWGALRMYYPCGWPSVFSSLRRQNWKQVAYISLCCCLKILEMTSLKGGKGLFCLAGSFRDFRPLSVGCTALGQQGSRGRKRLVQRNSLSPGVWEAERKGPESWYPHQRHTPMTWLPATWPHPWRVPHLAVAPQADNHGDI